MQKRGLLTLGLLLLIVACTPAVPYDQMNPDLYSRSQYDRMTANAALNSAQLQEQFLTATAQAPIVHITETAAAQSIVQIQTADALISQQQSWTATAQQSGTQTAIPMTQTAMGWTPTPNATTTAAFAKLNAEGTLTANNLERDRLALERQQVMNDFNAKVSAYSWVIVVLVVALLLMLVTRRWRYQAAKVDARGNVLPILDIVDGQFADIDRSPNFRGNVSDRALSRILVGWAEKKLGVRPMLPEITAERQDDVTHRDQLLDLASRGLPAPTKNEDKKKAAVGEMMTQFAAPLAPKVQIVSPEQVRPILMDVMPQIAQDSIEAELYNEKKEDGAV